MDYQITKPSTMSRASPLFSIRSKRTIDRDSKDLICDYVGKGEESVLSVPKRNDRAELLQKVIDSIKKMDDKTFNKFISLILSRIKQKSIDDEEIVIVLNQVKNNQEINETAVPLPSWNNPCTIGAWFTGCWIINIFITIVNSIHALLLWINNIRNSISYILLGCCETWN
ncbi:MAG: hypothetical protein JSW06_08590 [Thermoplasmatales archaeon]|nr:MAG: hypothetical protein JSW06_08590 [Thermoplasmatales archaeon]